MNYPKIVLWVGNAYNQKALACKIAEDFNVVGIVIENKKADYLPRKLSLILIKVLHKLRFGIIDNAWTFMQRHYKKKFPNWPDVKLLYVDTINSNDTGAFTENLQADLVVLSGTSLVREPLVSLRLPIGIINLHTGLSPYIKGGPNCTNWCIANNEWEYIGNTIMWLSSGIDSGNIITTEQTDISNSKNLSDIHVKVMEHAHDLYLRVIRYVTTNSGHLQSVPQKTIGEGRLFQTKMWTGKNKKRLLKNLNNRKSAKDVHIKTIPLPSNAAP